MSTKPDLQSRVHHAIVRGLIEHGYAPDAVALQAALGCSAQEISAALLELQENHGVVCHPGTTTPWVIHPFSMGPTGTWVAGSRHGWWAPCIWCGLGIAALVREDVAIHSKLGGEAKAIDLHVRQGAVVQDDIVVHFAVPPRNAWDNVHYYCSTVLAFESESEVEAWSIRHGISMGAVVPIGQVMNLAKGWYGGHAAADWKKWSIDQARVIFSQAGLRGPFWDLPANEQSGTF